VGRNTGSVRIAKFGMWRLAAADTEPRDLDAQINSIGRHTSVWKRLAAAFEVDLFCGLFMQRENEGLSISPESLAMLGERGRALALDTVEKLRNRMPNKRIDSARIARPTRKSFWLFLAAHSQRSQHLQRCERQS
jgi:hypothetical protein